MFFKLFFLAISSALLVGCASRPTGSALNGLGIALVPPYESVLAVQYSRSLNVYAAAGENDSIARRIKGALGDGLDKVSEKLATTLLDELSRVGVQSKLVAYAQADNTLKQSYQHVDAKYVLECVPQYLLRGERLSQISFYATCRLFQRDGVIVFTKFIGFGLPFVESLGPAFASKHDNYPVLREPSELISGIFARIEPLARGIALQISKP